MKLVKLSARWKKLRCSARIGIRPQDGYSRLIPSMLIWRRLALAGCAGQVAHRAGDNRYPVTALGKIARQLVMARASRLIQGGKCLVDQQDVHGLRLSFRPGQTPFTFKVDWQRPFHRV